MEDQPMGAQPSGSAQEHAAMLAPTRCRREFRCDTIGSDKKYPSLEVCQATLLADANKELGKCPKGMNRKKVQECAAAIDTKGCDLPGDSLTEYENAGPSLSSLSSFTGWERGSDVALHSYCAARCFSERPAPQRRSHPGR